jgi:adenosyl cobinamide kinase/adenosyl cobinamide phosphate guanylyltransferase
MALTMLLGGARSGKSVLAVTRASAYDGPVCFIATATAGDAEMAERIARHRRERPGAWETVEEPLELASALDRARASALVVVDCLTLWLSNQLAAGASERDVEEHARRAALGASARPAPVIAVSNEVGMGIVPADARVRAFRDLQGRVNATWVAHASEANLVVAGALLPLTLSAETR